MKRFLKIFSITLASIIGFVVVLVAAVVGIACHMVFTPAKLTPIVNEVAGQFVKTPYSIEEVDLTLISTFPDAGLRVRGLYVMNPMEGAQSDTLLGIPELIVGIDLQQYLDSQRLSVKTITAENVMLNAYINESGDVNWDILRPTSDSEEDTTATVLPFDVDVEELRLTTGQLSFVDRRDSLDIRNASLMIAATAQADRELRCIAAHLNNVSLDWESLQLMVDGDVSIQDQIHMQLQAKTNRWQIRHVLDVLPEQYARLVPKEINVDGTLQLAANIHGAYDDNTMPLVDARLKLSEGKGHYDLNVLPYELRDVDAELVAHVDLNDKTKTCANINKARARTRDSEITLTGSVTQILLPGKDIAVGNPECVVDANVRLNMKDIEEMISSEQSPTQVRGLLTGTVKINSRLDDITSVNINKINIDSKLELSGLDAIYQDSIHAVAERLNLELVAPRAKTKDKNLLSADCILKTGSLIAGMPGMAVDIAGGTISAAVEIDTKDTTNIPNLALNFDLMDVKAQIDSISAHVVAPRGQAKLTSNRRQKTVPQMRITLDAGELEAHMGDNMAAKTGRISVEANARYKKNEKNLLLQWNPRLNFDLHDGKLNLAMLPIPVDVPRIKFEYNNHNCHIDTSRIVLGKSDFALEGHLQNIGHWLNHQAKLVGNLTFTSNHTDVDEMLDIINGITLSDTTQSVAKAEEPVEPAKVDTPTESEPFIVPENISLALTTHIKEASAFGQHLTNLGGKLYVQEGVAVLEEIGFISEAARLQLTGIYKTPRRDHIYVGLDYHMVDIDLQQLVAMIPQIDTLVPMLSSLRGAAEFHIAAETFVNSRYEIKPSTLRGACSIEGKNLVLLDNETFSQIAKLLMFNKKTENLVDSISAQITLYKDQVSVYPFCLSMDNYMVAVGGNHYLDMNFNYHASVLSPIYLGVDVKGNLDDLKIGLAPCRYAKDFKPLFHRDVDEKAAGIRRMISESLKKNVVIE